MFKTKQEQHRDETVIVFVASWLKPQKKFKKQTKKKKQTKHFINFNTYLACFSSVPLAPPEGLVGYSICSVYSKTASEDVG